MTKFRKKNTRYGYTVLWRPENSPHGMTTLLEAQTLYRKGDLIGAQAACMALIQRNPRDMDALYLLAVTAIDTGALDMAGDILTTLMRVAPSRADVHGSAGVLALRRGMPDRALEPLVRACRIVGDPSVYLQNLVPALAMTRRTRAAGRLGLLLQALVPWEPRALDLFARYAAPTEDTRTRTRARQLALDPTDRECLQDLAGSALLPSRMRARLRRRTAAVAPADPTALANIAALAIAAGADREAARHLAVAQRIGPSCTAAANSAVLLARRNGAAAETSLRSATLAIALSPGSAQGWEAMATIRDLVQAPGSAIPFWRRCLAVSGDPFYGVPLAASLRMADRLEEAESAARRAIVALESGSPAYDRAVAALAAVLRGRNRAREAVETVALVSADRQPAGVRVRDALTLPIVLSDTAEIGHWRTRLTDSLDRLESDGIRLDDPFREVGQTAFHAAYHGLDDRPLQERIARFFRTACPALAFDAPHLDRDRRKGSRVRIGFISRFLKDHTIGKLMAGLIAGLDRERFEVVLLPFAAQSDAVTASLARQADRHVPLPSDLFRARAAIADQALDILFYCDIGMDPLTYFLAYSRLARVQCVTWGHPVTTGLDSIDAFLSADRIERPGAEADYTERLIRLPRLPAVYRKPDAAADMAGVANPVAGLARVYSCPQSTFKFHPDFDRVWAAIADRDPQARLVIVDGKDPGWDETLKRRLARSHPSVARRLVILPRLKRGAFFQLLAHSAATLDPLHFGSGNTAYETFAVGTPMVTLPGRYMRGRVVDGCYRQMGIDALTAETVEDYADKVVRLGQDRDWRDHCMRLILDANAALYDDGAAVRAVEDALTALMTDPEPGPLG